MDLAFGRKFDNQMAAMTLGPNFNSLSVVVCLPLSRSLAVSLEISHTVSFSLCLSLSLSVGSRNPRISASGSISRLRTAIDSPSIPRYRFGIVLKFPLLFNIEPQVRIVNNFGDGRNRHLDSFSSFPWWKHVFRRRLSLELQRPL